MDDQFDCGNGFCISKSFVCDGTDDCQNMRDENELICGNVLDLLSRVFIHIRKSSNHIFE